MISIPTPEEPFVFPRTGHIVRNRTVLAAMTNKQSHPDGTLSRDEINWLLKRAEGGFGIITTAATHVAETGQGWVGEMGVWGDHQITSLRELSTGIREYGALSLAQIFHGGMRAPEDITGHQPLSASVNDCEESHSGKSRAATNIEICNIIEAFGDAAARCAEAGFDGVELHGAHGYLICQFLGEKTNRRDDEWGGDSLARTKFLIEIIQNVKSKTPENFIIGVRISPEHHRIGVRIHDTIMQTKQIIEEGIDFLHISCWDCFTPPSEFPEDTRTITEWFTEKFRNQTPIISTGAVWTTADAKHVLDQGADLVGVGRVAIGHADWASHIEHPDYSPTRPPFSAKHLKEQGLSDIFIEYMRNWKGFVE